MKNFFQRKPDAPHPTRSNAAYNVWLPPAEASSRAPGQNWMPTSGRDTSTTYKYATGNNPYPAYYQTNPPQAAAAAYPAHYYPDRPDSRLGNVPYQYNPYGAPAATTTQSRAPEPIARADKAPRVPRRSSSSSIKGDAGLKKSKHKTREARGAETDVDKGPGRKDPKRDRRSRLATEEAGDSSDSSMQRPSRRRLEEGKMVLGLLSLVNRSNCARHPRCPVEFERKADTSSPADASTPPYAWTTSRQRAPDPVADKKAKESRGLWPFSRSKSTQPELQGKVKPRADSTPSRYLPPTNDPYARRPDTRRNASDSALSESSRQVPPPQDSLLRPGVQSSRGFFFTESSSRPITTAPIQSRPSNNDPSPNPGIQPSKHPPPAAIPPPGYRSGPLPANSTANGSSSGGSAAPQDSRPRATGSDNRLTTEPSFQPVTALRARHDPPLNPGIQTIPAPTPMHYPSALNGPTGLANAPYHNDRAAAPQDSRFRSMGPDPRFQSTDPSSARPAALQALRSRSANPSAQPLEHPPPNNTAGPLPVTSSPMVTTSGVGHPVMERAYTPSRRDLQPNLPPIYAPPPSVRAPAPKVSQLVAGFEARSSDRPPARREPSMPQMHAPPEQPHRAPADNSSKPHARREPSLSQLRQSSQGSGSTSANPAHRPTPASHPYLGPPQPSKAHPLPTESSSNPPDALRTQLRDLLTDKASASRNDGKVQTRHLPPESRPNIVQPFAPPPPKPPDHQNPSAQLYPSTQPPVQVYTSHKTKSGGETIPAPVASSSRRPDVVSHHPELDRASRVRVVDDREMNRSPNPSSNPPPASSSRRAQVPHQSEPDRSSRVGRVVDDRDIVDRTPGRSSRSKKDFVGVMKTPSKDSSHSTSSPSAPTRSSPQLASVPSSRNPEPSNMRSVAPNTTSSSTHRDRTKAHSSKTPPSPSPRARASTSTHPFPSEQPAQPPNQTFLQPASGQSASRPRVPSQESILRTPSSLASVLPPTGSHTSLPASVSAENRKKGLVPPPDRAPRPSAEDRRSKRWQAPQAERAGTSEKPRQHKSKGPPPPITIPNPATRPSDRKSPNATRVFTPFRYLSNKRRRPNTVLGSPTTSMQSSQIQPAQSPPRRDSEVVARGGKLRRKRPGVVFDVGEDPLEESRARPARAKK
ncbi:hypothetical protein FB45DRAFT_912756, partial [Roridomyces roridus]